MKRLSTEVLEQAGLISQAADAPGIWRERFRGRLIFPIHDDRGRTLGFGARILPEVERKMAELGKSVAKYVNSPETLLFHKLTLVYGADLARVAARESGWVAVVEGYTDVIAAHPLEQGLAELVTYLSLAAGDGTSFIDDGQHQTLTWTDEDGTVRQGTLPMVMFCRPAAASGRTGKRG